MAAESEFGDRLLRVVELGVNSAADLELVKRNATKLWGDASVEGNPKPYGLNLVVFGPIDFLCLQQVPDLKSLAVAPSRGPCRFQRVVGAWTEDQLPSYSTVKPYVAVCHVKVNPLADLIAGDQVIGAVARHINTSPDGFALYGIDSSKLIALRISGALDELERFAWSLRQLTLGDLGLDLSRKPVISQIFGRRPSANELQEIRALSWSHSLVGLPVPFVVGKDNEGLNQEFLDRPQQVKLQTRFRLRPGGDPRKLPHIDDARSVFGGNDLIVEHPPGSTNGSIIEILRAVWREGANYLVDTEVQFCERSSCGEQHDVLTQEYLARDIDLGLELNGEAVTLDNLPRLLRQKRWNYQQVNAAVNLLLAYTHRASDPFDIGQAWRLRRPFQYWMNKIEDLPPSHRHVRRWRNYLERSVRLESNVEDFSQPPSQSLTFAFYGGQVALREAFTVYVNEFVEQRSKVYGRKIEHPLVVDGSDSSLRVRATFDSFVLLLSGFQVQAMPLWPSAVHELEHIFLRESFERETPLTEALCDLALIDSGAVGDVERDGLDTCLENATRVIMGSLMPLYYQWTGAAMPSGAKPPGEARRPDEASGADEVRPDEAKHADEIKRAEERSKHITHLQLRIAYLWVLAHDRAINLRSLKDAFKSPWWLRWAESMDATTDAEVRVKRLESLYQRHCDKKTFDVRVPERQYSEPGPCGRIIWDLLKAAPRRWSHEGAERNVNLSPELVCTALDRLRAPVWQSRRKYLLELRPVPGSR